MDKNERDLIQDLFGELSEERQSALEDHLEEHSALRRERADSRRVLDHYRQEGLETPPPFDYSKLEDPPAAVPGRTPWARLAATVLLLVGAFILGRKTASPPPIPTAGSDPPPAVATPSSAADNGSALRQPRVAERIAWITHAARSRPLDPSVAEEVRFALRQDPNVNVRLAAVDALFVEPQLAPPATQLRKILANEPNQPLRLALVDWLASARPPGWRETLRSGAQIDRNPVVRARIDRYLGSRS